MSLFGIASSPELRQVQPGVESRPAANDPFRPCRWFCHLASDQKKVSYKNVFNVLKNKIKTKRFDWNIEGPINLIWKIEAELKIKFVSHMFKQLIDLFALLGSFENSRKKSIVSFQCCEENLFPVSKIAPET